jgi:tetratricopeptide (TPR) repeat protein
MFMRIMLTKLGGILLCGLCLASPALPQAPNDKGKTLDAIVAMDDANARITALQQFIKTNPNQVTAREALVASYAQLGENQLGENNVEKAVGAFQRAIKALPKSVSNEFFSQTVSMIPAAISVRGYRAEAVSIAQLLETRFANEPTRLGAIGEYYLTIDASSEAVRVLEIAAQLAPEDPRLHRALGMAYRMGLRIDEAVASYQLAVKYSPQDRRAFYDLADLYRSQGAYDDALKLYRRQLEVEPKHSPSHKGLALALTALGKDDEAAAELNIARDLDGSIKTITDDQLLQTQLAFYFLARNKLKEAELAANASLAFEPRYSWARIVAAEILLAQGKFFEAERHLIEAQKLANFPTLAFTLGKVYLLVEDFDGAAEQFKKAFRYTANGKFTTRLGGVRNLETNELRELLAPEHQAAIFLAEAPTSDETFRIAESLVRVNAKLAEEEKTTALRGVSLETAAQAFVQAEGSRRSFRALFMATRLAQAGKALPVAIRLAEQALELAEVATEENGSLRDYPNYDHAGRLQIFRGRAYDARGWALFKSNRLKESLNVLSQAVNEYGELPEGKRALWHLATAYEAAGSQSLALEMYLAAYEPPAVKNAADIQRTVIENLYRKVNGSLTGLDDALGQPLKAATLDNIVATAKAAPPIESATPAEAAPAPVVAAITRNETPNEIKAKESTAPAAAMIVTRKPEKVAARPSEPAASSSAPPPAKEPVRVGLFGIPVAEPGKKNGRPALSQAPPKKPAEPEVKQPETKAAPEKTVVASLPTAPPPVQDKPVVAVVPSELPTVPPVKETSATPETPNRTEPTKPKLKTPDELAQVEMNKVEQKVTVPSPPAPVSEPVKPSSPPSVEASPRKEAPLPTVRYEPLPAANENKPAPVRLPDIESYARPALTFVALGNSLPPMPTNLALISDEDVPPPPAAPKPALSAAAAATQASTEPTVTVRYENLPNSSAPAGESGHAPPVSIRPRRVTEPKPENNPPAQTRQRRVKN